MNAALPTTIRHSDQYLGKSGSDTPTPWAASGWKEESPEPVTSDETQGPAREVLVIGDLHGHIDRFEALLRQEALIDRCERCNGGGVTYLDSDKDEMGGDCEHCQGDGWARTDKPVDVVLLGDVGHFGKDGSPTGDMMMWRAARNWADVILWGNHDRAVVSDSMCHKGYLYPLPETLRIMAECHDMGKLKLAHAAHGFLMTHAGLGAAFRYQDVAPVLKKDPQRFADWINMASDEHAPASQDQKAIRDAISAKRGGRVAQGGILWRDISEKLYSGFRQVFGHSADHAEHEVRYVAEKFYTRKRKDYDIWSRVKDERPDPSYCIDVGGSGKYQGDNCVAGIYLPSEKIVRVDL